MKRPDFRHRNAPTKSSTTGVRNVHQKVVDGRRVYEGQFYFRNINFYCGRHETIEDAARAVEQRRRELGCWETEKERLDGRGGV